jgi:hypothetical protein
MRIAALVSLALAASPLALAQTDRVPLALVVHVGQDADGAPLMTEAAVVRAVAETNQLFAGASVCFVPASVRALPGVSELENVRARRALARLTENGAVHVFLVAAIRDAHPSATTVRASEAVGREPSGWISGAHIPRRRGFPDTYVVATARAVSTWNTLSHELGHVMGESHTSDPANLMSYGTERTGFSDAQLARIARRARRLARRPWLPADAADCP